MSIGHYALFSSAAASAPVTSGWAQVAIGAGGAVTGVNVTLNGGVVTKFVRTDASGAYRFNNATQMWEQLITRARMPATDVGASYANGQLFMNGCYEIVAAPSDNTRVYMLYNASGPSAHNGFVFVSNDGGSTFARTAGVIGGSGVDIRDVANIDPIKQMGYKMAVDPVNKDICYAGTCSPTGGLAKAYVTFNGGTTWAVVPSIPDSTGSISGYLRPTLGFCFDVTSGTTANSGGTGVKTNTVYCVVQGSGVWRTTDGGTSWALATGSPNNARNAVISSDGTYYVCDLGNYASANPSKVWRHKAADAITVWTDVTPPTTNSFEPTCLAVSPFNPATIIAIHSGGALKVSNNYGASTWNADGGINGIAPVLSPDIPWLAVNVDFTAIIAAQMDLVTDGLLWMTTGIGVMYYQFGASYATTAPATFTTKTKGIEEIVVNSIISPPGGVPLIINWDRPVFRIVDPMVYATTYYPDYLITERKAISQANDADWASTNPSYIGLLCNSTREDSGYSTDGGVHWQRFTLNQNAANTAVDGRLGGGIAVSTPQCQMICQSNNGDVWYTTDGWGAVNQMITAAQWNAGGATGMQNANIPSRSITTGWGWNQYLRRHMVAADRVRSKTFLIGNYNANSAGGGFYQVTFPSDVLTISRIGDIPEFCGNNAQLWFVPNLSGVTVPPAGHVFHTTGIGNTTKLWINRIGDSAWASAHGANAWQAAFGTGECQGFGFGAVKPGNDYPSVFYLGRLADLRFGVFRSDNSAADWLANTAIVWTTISNDLPLNSTCFAIGLTGDSNVWGRCQHGARRHEYHVL